jgi:hypothetical protein
MRLTDQEIGSPETPEAFLSIVGALLSLEEVNAAIAACRELYGLAITEDTTKFLEGELIDDNIESLRLSEIAIVEWGPDWALGEEHNATVYRLPMQDVVKLILVRWWNDVPHWWSYGEDVEDLDAVINSLERKVGRNCNRVVRKAQRD